MPTTRSERAQAWLESCAASAEANGDETHPGSCMPCLLASDVIELERQLDAARDSGNAFAEPVYGADGPYVL